MAEAPPPITPEYLRAHARILSPTVSAYPADVLMRAAEEIEGLRRLVGRLTNVVESLAGELSDPGTEAAAAIHCGRHLIYG